MITFLTDVVVALKTIEVLAVLALVLIGVDMTIFLFTDPKKVKKPVRIGRHTPESIAKELERQRKENEAAAQGVYFDDTNCWGFDRSGEMYYRGASILAQSDATFYEVMDELADNEIFVNTKDI